MDEIIVPPQFEDDVEEDEPPNIEQELENFRHQWRNELQQSRSGSPASAVGGPNKAGPAGGAGGEASVEDQAKYLFMQGVNSEQNGRLYEAIRYYRRAVQLVPDIEFRFDYKLPRRERQESESSVESGGVCEEEEDGEFIQNLQAHFVRLTLQQNAICYPAEELPTSEAGGTHISALPIEVIHYIFKWVVSNELDINSLERLAEVCRGFYLCARDEELWKLICQKVWGVNVGSRPKPYSSWRHMYIERPHIRYHGCYISKMSYVRQGEKGLDNFYRPYHVVEYYRYVRFFPDGHMLMLTTPTDPYSCVGKLKSRHCKMQGILHGYYKMAGDQVTGVLKRVKTPEPMVSTYGYYRKKKRNQNQNDSEQTFHVEFQSRNIGRQRLSRLEWVSYTIRTLYKSSGQENVAEFEITKQNYPTLHFSPVLSYTATADGPLN